MPCTHGFTPVPTIDLICLLHDHQACFAQTRTPNFSLKDREAEERSARRRPVGGAQPDFCSCSTNSGVLVASGLLLWVLLSTETFTTVLISSYPFIRSLINLLSEARGQLVELGYLSGGPPGAKPNDSGGRCLLLHCFQYSDKYENTLES